MERKPRLMGDGTAFGALVAAIRDLRQPKHSEVSPVPDDVQIDGRTCLVTGANSGLGKAAAVELARRGGNMILACRLGHGESREEIKRLSGSATVETMEVDLADLDSVHRLCRPSGCTPYPHRHRADECRADASQGQEISAGIRHDVRRSVSFPHA